MNKQILNLDLTSVIVISACVGFILWTAYSVFHDNHVQIYAENGLIEMIQTYLLAIASVIYLVTAASDNRSDKLIIMFCSLLCFSFLLREVDVEKLDIPHALVLMGSGTGRNVLLTVAFLAILICAAVKHAYYKDAAFEFVRSRAGWMLLAGGAFLWFGDFFEAYHPMDKHNVFVEEMNELVAYVLILLSSIAANSFISGTKHRSAPSASSR